MTVGEYISQKLLAFGIKEANLVDAELNSGICMDDRLDGDNAADARIALIGVLEELLLAPRQTSVSEGGFSMTWNFDDAAKYYLWLCRKAGKTPAQEVQGLLKISVITDKTDIW